MIFRRIDLHFSGSCSKGAEPPSYAASPSGIVAAGVANALMVRIRPSDQRFQRRQKRAAELGQFVFDARRDLGEQRSLDEPVLLEPLQGARQHLF